MEPEWWNGPGAATVYRDVQPPVHPESSESP